ncbi:MAG: hypothetical protein IIW19_06435 [Clostridia bacterium]|jgi:hypothetical protein|nr:hypothetical protein [Clostridia bacterium]MBO7157737.1 hypothetical protein [Clostridia bacterium]MBQ5792331.1 hypothetical protein [Clostridia bacterium]
MKLLAGVKGTGKTKALIQEVNKVCGESHGSIVCVEKGKKLTFDVSYQARLVDTEDYGIAGADMLYGFLCGILSQNYDITEIFIDNAYAICGGKPEELEAFLVKAEEITSKNNVACLVTASVDPALLSDKARAYMA